ncbi:P-loop containing nucleoside triphosphate hydrolase protein [Phakopsora pachyrhizi]|uniref:P-loop containing nucleoside triphosphate hydrolase protein n=1 Tax=Phakopsora pachyrhizi TaxID=170000 RepID=A0AAV0B7R4_PHAPC|nr:P-loop containing nucleoside triphosphate hydrolase protein [Phakopsora pachyrhizi]CAH7682063.1 P-loop containing nucleoside triphosphate hydrolase protein [Phakopsora pachyrhizi]
MTQIGRRGEDEVAETNKQIRTTAATSTPSKTFSSLGVEPSLVAALKAMSITSPSEIQERAIPDILAGRDCIGSSHTGSGKTIAFAIPILQSLSKDPAAGFCLILTPTRELAFQIGSQFKALGSIAVPGFTHSVIVGGMDMISQAIELNQRPHIIIATPGRLVDHLRSTEGEVGKWNLKRCKFLVLDEADRMLTSTFSEPLAYLINEQLPPPSERQTLLFTATVTEPVMGLAQKTHPGKPKAAVHLCGPAQINLPTALKQFYSFIPSQVKDVYLYYLLINLCNLTGLSLPPKPKPSTSQSQNYRKKPVKYSNRAKRLIGEDEEDDPILNLPQTIIFVSRPRTAESIHLMLESSQLPYQIPSRCLHSNQSQNKRLESIREFEERKVRVLVSTELGSRGLDLKQVKAVINWDLPLDPNEYVHRVGRTARKSRTGGDEDGISISFVCERDLKVVLRIEERIGMKLEEIKLEEEKVLEFLNPIKKADREAQLELDEMKFGEKQRINKLKYSKKQKLLKD